ncbi:thiolase family protein [Calidifontibacter indicus]|uniref:thiolase family protein n=1 Tax=Calidifontibacter indicus TaxID=419650 RepID=UPI003D708D7B
MTGALIVAARRTPIGTAGHGLASVSAADLGSAAIGAVVADVEEMGEIADLGGVPDEVVLGNCMGPGGNVARVAALRAGLPDAVPAFSVDRQCASGLAAIEIGARLVQTGRRLVVAGGVESASTAPWRMWPPRDGGEPVRYERAPFAPEHRDLDMGYAADLLAAEHGITRARQDAYAARSHARAVEAIARGEFDDEVVPVGAVVRDERPRAGLGVAQLSRFRPLHRADGTVTVGNSCGINDAAASVGVAPERPGIGIVPAVQAALAEAGVGIDDVDVFELNEAFAGQVLACYDALGIDPDRVCLDGGALALGHPWGASGAVLVVRLFTQLVRRGRGRIGLAAIAAGGGQGTALVVSACP